MAEYMEETWQELEDRWKGHEEELKALIPIIKIEPEWEKSEEYKAVIEVLGSLPRFAEEVKRDFRGADLEKADLSGAKLWESDFSGAKLWEANLSGADMRKADFSKARLWEADLSGTVLREAIFWKADLRKTRFPGADLWKASLSGADLRGSDFSGADLRVANLSNTYSWFDVKWNPKNRLWPRVRCFDFRGKKLKPSKRKTLFGINDIRNANWSGAAMLKRYVEDENFLEEYKRRPGWGHKTISFLWNATCDYGRSFGRWAIWSFFFALFFGGLYATHPTWFQQEIGPFSPWYFSVVTFTTLGFGDLTPKPECWQAQAWVVAEVILGYIMLGGLISIFANKLARRA